MKVVTAERGKALRDYAKKFTGVERVAIFPESGLSPNEQALFIKARGSDFDIIITFSAFIISDADEVEIIDCEKKIKAGSSINQITMSLWRSQTVGELVKDKFTSLRQVANNGKQEQIDCAIDQAYQLGDSIERTLFISFALSKANSLADLNKSVA